MRFLTKRRGAAGTAPGMAHGGTSSMSTQTVPAHRRRLPYVVVIFGWLAAMALSLALFGGAEQIADESLAFLAGFVMYVVIAFPVGFILAGVTWLPWQWIAAAHDSLHGEKSCRDAHHDRFMDQMEPPGSLVIAMILAVVTVLLASVFGWMEF